jgi:hypothetical protein
VFRPGLPASTTKERTVEPEPAVAAVGRVARHHSDNKIGDDETLLMKHLVRVLRDQHQVVDNQLANVVDIDPSDVWKRLDAESGDLTELLDVADRVATVDGDITAHEKEVIAELHSRCRRA